MNEPTKDPLFEALRSAPKVDVDEWRQENLRLRARRELVRAGRPASTLEAMYFRVVEPLGVALFSGGWIAWTLQRILAIYGG